MTYHPWRHFRAFDGWTLVIRDLEGEGMVGETDYDAQTVTICSTLNQAGRRSTIAHEIVHIERGWVQEHCADLEDEQVDRIVARRLISFERLMDACRWARNIHELADELWVDEETVRTRLAHLHPSERLKLREVLHDKGD
jgi:hypothetical protein